MNNKNFKRMMILAVVLLLTIVGVGYAALSTNLTINGAGKVNSSSWKIKFSNLGEATLGGQATEVTKPTISNNDTHIGDYVVTFTSPGDSIEYALDVVNLGTFNAEISSITVDTPTCTGSGDTAINDAKNVCDYLTYTLTYADGTAVEQGDTLNIGETKSMKLKLAYLSNVLAEQLPSDDVTIADLEVTIVYTQN